MRLWPKYVLIGVYSLFLLGSIISVVDNLSGGPSLGEPSQARNLANMVAVALTLPLALFIYGLATSRWWTLILHAVAIAFWLLIWSFFALMIVPQYIIEHDVPRLLLLGLGYLLPLASHVYLWRNRITLFPSISVSSGLRIAVWTVSILYMLLIIFLGVNLLAAIDLAA